MFNIKAISKAAFRDGSACAITLRQKFRIRFAILLSHGKLKELQIRVAISPSHGILTPDQPVLARVLKC